MQNPGSFIMGKRLFYNRHNILRNAENTHRSVVVFDLDLIFETNIFRVKMGQSGLKH